jgi:hypothetical protein
MAKAKSLSTSLPAALETRLRTISVRENRSVANVMENAVRVFTLMPKNLRDRLVELSADERTADAAFAELSRQLLFELARRKYDRASENLARSGEVDRDMLAEDEMTIVASRLSSYSEARPTRA